jgi:hypothetical protein
MFTIRSLSITVRNKSLLSSKTVLKTPLPSLISRQQKKNVVAWRQQFFSDFSVPFFLEYFLTLINYYFWFLNLLPSMLGCLGSAVAARQLILR